MKNLVPSHVIIIISLGLSFLLVLVFLFWWIYPYNLVTAKQPFEILTPVVQQGDVLLYKMDYCKKTDLVPTVNRQFVDGLIYTLPVGSSVLVKGCRVITNSIEVPKNLPPGIYYIQSTAQYQVNPIRTILYDYKTAKFEVTK